MGQKKSDILTFGRKLHDIGRVVVEAVYAAGGDDADAERIFQKALQGQLGQLVMGQLQLVEPTIFSTTYDQSLGLMPLIKLAVGENNCNNIHSDITPERFPLKGAGVRKVNLRVEPYLNNETSEQAAQRLVAAGHTLANTGDLAGFLHGHPKEVEKWSWVLAISEDSRWTDPGGRVCVPCADVDGAYRYFGLYDFRLQLDSDYGVLVSSESGI